MAVSKKDGGPVSFVTDMSRTHVYPLCFFFLKFYYLGTSLAVEWLRPHVSTAVGVGPIPGRGTDISRAARQVQKKKSLEAPPCSSLSIQRTGPRGRPDMVGVAAPRTKSPCKRTLLPSCPSVSDLLTTFILCTPLRLP